MSNELDEPATLANVVARGAVLEDGMGKDPNNLPLAERPRPLNHFYDPENGWPLAIYAVGNSGPTRR